MQLQSDIPIQLTLTPIQEPTLSNTIPVHDQHNRKPELQSKARNTKSYHSQMNLPYNTKQRLSIYTKFTIEREKLKDHSNIIYRK